MVEDLDLNRVLKGALEADGAFAPPEAARARVRPLYWAPPFLLAASLAVVAAFQCMLKPAETPTEAAISLLSCADELDFGDQKFSSPEEMLLAWQEAPYQNSELSLLN